MTMRNSIRQFECRQLSWRTIKTVHWTDHSLAFCLDNNKKLERQIEDNKQHFKNVEIQSTWNKLYPRAINSWVKNVPKASSELCWCRNRIVSERRKISLPFSHYYITVVLYILNPKSHNEYSTGGVESEYFLGFGANDATAVVVSHFLQSLFTIHIPAE